MWVLQVGDRLCHYFYMVYFLLLQPRLPILPLPPSFFLLFLFPSLLTPIATLVSMAKAGPRGAVRKDIYMQVRVRVRESALGWNPACMKRVGTYSSL